MIYKYSLFISGLLFFINLYYNVPVYFDLFFENIFMLLIEHTHIYSDLSNSLVVQLVSSIIWLNERYYIYMYIFYL